MFLLHGGEFCLDCGFYLATAFQRHVDLEDRSQLQLAELELLQAAGRQIVDAGMLLHAGHGLNYRNVQPVASIDQMAELNIGHYLIGEAVFTGLEPAIRRMRDLMDEARD